MGGYRRLTAEIEERQRAQLNSVLVAVREGTFWDIVKAELARDYSSLFDAFLWFEKHVDTDFESHAAPRD